MSLECSVCEQDLRGCSFLTISINGVEVTMPSSARISNRTPHCDFCSTPMYNLIEIDARKEQNEN
jgi:hypothetical protein